MEAVAVGVSPDGRVKVLSKSCASPGPRFVMVKPNVVFEPVGSCVGEVVSARIARFALCSIISPVFGSIHRGKLSFVIGVPLRTSWARMLNAWMVSGSGMVRVS